MAHKDLHPIDLLSEEFWQSVQRHVQWMREALQGPVPVGTRKGTREEQLRAFMEMAPEARTELSQQRDLKGIRQTMFDLLGDHALNILPYLGLPETEGEQ